MPVMTLARSRLKTLPSSQAAGLMSADHHDGDHNHEEDDGLGPPQQRAHTRALSLSATSASVTSDGGQILDEAAAVHQHDAAAVLHQLRHIVGDHQHGKPASDGEIADLAMDAGLRADVHAHGRAVQHQDARVVHQPAPDHHALLVAAGELDHRPVAGRRGDLHVLRSSPTSARALA